MEVIRIDDISLLYAHQCGQNIEHDYPKNYWCLVDNKVEPNGDCYSKK